MTEHLSELTTTGPLLAVASLMALICGVMGPYVLLRRLSFLAETLAHGSIAGIGLGMALGLAPSLTLLPFAVFLALALTWVSRNREEDLPSVTAMAFAGCVGVGIILMTRAGVEDPHEIVHILFGDFHEVATIDLVLLFLIGVPALFFMWRSHRQLTLTFLDENLAVAAGFRPERYQYIFMAFTALVIAMCLKLVGVVLVMALITIPALIAGRLARSLNQQVILSPFIAIGCTLTGLWISRSAHLAPGPCIATLSSAWYVLAILFYPRRRSIKNS